MKHRRHKELYTVETFSIRGSLPRTAGRYLIRIERLERLNALVDEFIRIS
jgi:hypothetical protein